MRLGRSRAAWLSGGAAVVLVAVVAVGTALEHTSPRSGTITAGCAEGPQAGPQLPGLTVPQTTQPAAPHYVFPVGAPATYAHTHHDYPAADMIAACGSPVLAVTDGTILEVSREDDYDAKADDGALRGGLFVSLLGDDGVRYYGSHLRAVLPGIDATIRVTAGQKLGEVGDTGDAGVCHLHFGISPPCTRTGDWWVRRGVIFPWPYLDAWQTNKPTTPLPEITTWQKAHGCPPAP
jgi:peptidoglycan LD-endopeptidase LytH